jgi:replicative DNA helicase
MKVEKIDGIMLKYAFTGRRYMIDMVNRGIRSEYFAPGADQVFRLLFEIFTDPTVNSVISQEAFMGHCHRLKMVETAAFADALFKKMSSLPSSETDFTFYMKEFRDRHNLIVAKRHVDSISEALASGAKADELNEMYHKAWSDVAALNRVEVFDEGSLGADISNMRAEYEAVRKDPHGYRGVTVGLPSLDNLTNGFQPSELIIVAGMEGTGKSLVMMNMGINAWLGTNRLGKEILPTGKNVLYFTLEMPRSNRGKFGTAGYLNRRILSSVAELSFSGLRKSQLNPTEEKKLMDTIDFIAEYDKHNKFYVVDIPRGATVEDIEIKFQELREKFPVHLVIIDYMGIMAGSSTGKGDDADWQAQGQIAAGLHEFARSASVPVVTGVQVNRPQGKNNSLKDQNYNTTRIARSAQISQNANIVMQIGCRDQEENYIDMPMYLTKMRDGNKGLLTFTKGFDRMRIYDGVPAAPAELDRFEDALPSPAAIPTVADDLGQYEISSSGKLDFGTSDEEGGFDYSEADF